MNTDILPYLISDPASEAERNLGDERSSSKYGLYIMTEKPDLHHLYSAEGMGRLLLYIYYHPYSNYWNILQYVGEDEHKHRHDSWLTSTKWMKPKTDTSHYPPFGYNIYSDLLTLSRIAKMVVEEDRKSPFENSEALVWQTVYSITPLGEAVLQQNGLLKVKKHGRK